MSRTSLVARGLAPIAAAAVAVGMLAGPAWANPPGPRPQPHPPVNQSQCVQGRGHVVVNPRTRARSCQGGPMNGRSVN